MADPHEEVTRLTTALEDIVTLAHSSLDARQRLTQMERRAIAALSGEDRQASEKARKLRSGRTGESNK
ncbi:MAG: hypothetical protein WD942_03075 [Dehalococcoidia bacterium]